MARTRAAAPAAADSVTESPAAPAAPVDAAPVDAAPAAPSWMDVADAIRRADGASRDEESARLRTDAAAIHAARSAFARVKADGVTAKVAVAELRTCGVVIAESSFAALWRSGEVLSIPGELPEAVRPSDVKALYLKQATIGGRKRNVYVKPAQHAAVVSTAADLGSAYAALLAHVRKNAQQIRAAADAAESASDAAEQAGDAADEQADAAATTPEATPDTPNASAAAILRDALEMVRRACAVHDGTDPEVQAVAAEIVGLLSA